MTVTGSFDAVSLVVGTAIMVLSDVGIFGPLPPALGLSDRDCISLAADLEAVRKAFQPWLGCRNLVGTNNGANRQRKDYRSVTERNDSKERTGC